MISRRILNTIGWKVEGNLPPIRKCVIIAAPHTSMLDFVLGKLFLYSLSLDAKILMKKELFIFPLNIIIQKMGGIPVDRYHRNQIIAKMVDNFNNNENYFLAITPEGTRKRVIKWRTGFYYIAYNAGVPIPPVCCDYKRRTISIGELFYPSGNLEKDISILQAFFKNVTPYYPSRFYSH